ncbi:hypothetical protein AREALGSMS7_01021 [Arenibacter algicola]|uniref:Uncharacterized protein n=1 Tax=Arenibacter algicola TaxID=616991 RepID=A0A221UT53_9FLAO|nr:hypothetical protein AREALGSMS7_01021 [Arenibacter algicola]
MRSRLRSTGQMSYKQLILNKIHIELTLINAVMFYGNYIKKFLVGYLVKDRLGVIAQGGFLFIIFSEHSIGAIPRSV